MRGVDVLYVLVKTPGLYHVSELRNLLIFIFLGIWGVFLGGLGGLGGVKYAGSGQG